MTPRHADGLWQASRDPRTWHWLSIAQPVDARGARRVGRRGARACAASGSEIPLRNSLVQGVVGSTRFLALRPEHRSVEIGWTWLHPDAWGTGVNVEAKLLMLRHAFDAWGCRRVELKTDALNDRSRGAMEAMGATLRGDPPQAHARPRGREPRQRLVLDHGRRVARRRAVPGGTAAGRIARRKAVCCDVPGIREELEPET